MLPGQLISSEGNKNMRATVSNDYGFKGMNHEDMKASYKRLVKIHHPDLNPNDRESATERTKILNAEFAYWYSRAATDYVRSEKVAEEKEKGNTTKAERHAQYYNESFAELLERLILDVYATNIDMLDGVSVDLKGVFVWISGIKPEHVKERNAIKELGFTGGWKRHDDGTSEYMWKCTPFLKRFGSNNNIDDISRKYGSINKNRTKYGMTVSR